jgi:bifunctional DNase/RNase
MTAGNEIEWVDMRVVNVQRSAATDELPERHVIQLEGVDGSHSLSLGVGPFEATALAMRLEDTPLPRPGPYDFIGSLLSALGATVQEVRLTRLAEGTFYAEAVLIGQNGEAQIDARPSDVLNLALVVKAPIRADAALLSEVANRSYRQERVKESEPSGSAKIVADARDTWQQAKSLAALASDSRQAT